jgi:hypothetical protein
MSLGTSLRIVCGSYRGPRRRARARVRRRNPLCVLAARSRAWREAGSGRQTRMRIDPAPGDGAGQARAAQSYLTAACAAPFRTNGDCVLKPSAMAQRPRRAPASMNPRRAARSERHRKQRLRRSPLLFRRQVGERTTPQNGRSPLRLRQRDGSGARQLGDVGALLVDEMRDEHRQNEPAFEQARRRSPHPARRPAVGWRGRYARR